MFNFKQITFIEYVYAIFPPLQMPAAAGKCLFRLLSGAFSAYVFIVMLVSVQQTIRHRPKT